jgi:hypothetical protein
VTTVLGDREPARNKTLTLAHQLLNAFDNGPATIQVPRASAFIGIWPTHRPGEYAIHYEEDPSSDHVQVQIRPVLWGEDVPPGFRFLQVTPVRGAIERVAMYAGPAEELP